MIFLAPVWIALAAAASVVVGVIHLIAWRLPRTVVLPTARFVPDEPARRAARTLRPADLTLLALRVGILMAAGAALARPVVHSVPSGRASVVAVDVSAAVGDTAALLDSLRSIPRGDATSFVVFDTAAQLTGDEAGVARFLSLPRNQRASLSVGLLAATREARRLGHDYEHVDVVLLSPFTVSSFDGATAGVRGTWADSIRVIRVAAAPNPPQANSVDVPLSGDDPVVAGIKLARANGLIRGESRAVREASTATDSAWVDSGRALVLWPRASAATGERVDAVHASGYTAIGHFIPQPLGDTGRVIARWANGDAAAREVARGDGCIRTIGFDVPDVGDFVLTPSFQRIVASLLGPCGRQEAVTQASDSMVTALISPMSPTPNMASRPAADVQRAPNRLAALIAMMAILLALTELFVRRRFGAVVTAGHAA